MQRVAPLEKKEYEETIKDDEQQSAFKVHNDNDDDDDDDDNEMKRMFRGLHIVCERTGHNFRSFSTEDKEYETLFGKSSFTTLENFPSSCYGLALHSIIQIFCVDRPYGSIEVEDKRIKKQKQEQKQKQEEEASEEHTNLNITCWWFFSVRIALFLYKTSILLSCPLIMSYFIIFPVLAIFFSVVFRDKVFNLRGLIYMLKKPWLFTYLIRTGKQVIDCISPAIASFLVQGVILYVIWTSLPSLDESNFCNHNIYLEIAILTVFYANIGSSRRDISLELSLVLHLRFVFYRDIGVLIELSNVSLLKLKLLVIILLEFGIWLGVLIVGTRLILTSDMPADIILAALTITFVNDIDNNFYEAFIRQDFKEDYENVLYSIPQNEDKNAMEDLDNIEIVLNAKLSGSKVPRAITSVAGCDRILYYMYCVFARGRGGSYTVLVPICLTIFQLQREYCSSY